MAVDLKLEDFTWFDENEVVLPENEVILEDILNTNNSPYAKHFDNSMGLKGHIYFKNQFLTLRNQQRYFFLRNLFIKNNPAEVLVAEKSKIPKIVHHIWIGDQPVPDYFKKFQIAWEHYHPGWTFKFWTDKEINAEQFETQDLWPFCSNIAQKVDIIRYEILLRWGGIYADTDCDCLASFDKLVHQYDFFSGILPEYPPRIGIFKRQVATPTLQVMNALIGSVPNHPILIQTIAFIRERLPKIMFSKRYKGINYIWQSESIRVVLSTMMPFRDAVFACADQNSKCNIVLPPTYFYPILPQHALSDGKRNSRDFMGLKPESMANHHYAASWSNKNGKKIRNILTKIKALKVSLKQG